MNSQYGSDARSDIEDMQEFFRKTTEIEWTESDKDYFDLFSSHFTFHLKIVEEIIKEAREILNPDNRESVKKLVAYVKEADEWFGALKKRQKSNMAVAN